jgi:hypothetical protein
MSVLGNVVQQPREALHYTIDYSCWLDTVAGEVLDPSINVIVSPTTTPALVVQAALSGTTAIQLLVSGGEDQTQYKVEIVALTSLSQIKEDEIKVTVRDT